MSEGSVEFVVPDYYLSPEERLIDSGGESK